MNNARTSSPVEQYLTSVLQKRIHVLSPEDENNFLYFLCDNKHDTHFNIGKEIWFYFNSMRMRQLSDNQYVIPTGISQATGQLAILPVEDDAVPPGAFNVGVINVPVYDADLPSSSVCRPTKAPAPSLVKGLAPGPVSPAPPPPLKRPAPVTLSTIKAKKSKEAPTPRPSRAVVALPTSPSTPPAAPRALPIKKPNTRSKSVSTNARPAKDSNKDKRTPLDMQLTFDGTWEKCEYCGVKFDKPIMVGVVYRHLETCHPWPEVEHFISCSACRIPFPSAKAIQKHFEKLENGCGHGRVKMTTRIPTEVIEHLEKNS